MKNYIPVFFFLKGNSCEILMDSRGAFIRVASIAKIVTSKGPQDLESGLRVIYELQWWYGENVKTAGVLLATLYGLHTFMSIMACCENVLN